MIDQTKTRRKFIKNVVTSGTLALTIPEVIYADDRDEHAGGENFTFLFQGDSITDGNRSRNNDWNHVMGHGYQYIIASKLWYKFPQKRFHFYNRGISGNTIADLAARWQTDTIDIKPDLLSILIGINDVNAYIDGNNSFSADAYEQEYKSLLQQTNHQLPNIMFVLCEPFILPVGKVKDKYDFYLTEIKKRQAIVRSLAIEFNAVYVPLQDAFNKALSKAPPDYWIWDGMHPMPAGHELMALEWMDVVSKKIKFIK